jgi:hypothetical protein
MTSTLMPRRQLLANLGSCLTFTALASLLYSQNRGDPTPSEDHPKASSRALSLAEHFSETIALASSQHPTVYCDFVLSILEHMNTTSLPDWFRAHIDDVLTKTSATNDLAPYRTISFDVADTVPSLHNTAIRKTRSDRLTLQCRALRLLAQLDPNEAARRFLSLTIPTQKSEPASDRCSPQIYDYREYYHLGIELLQLFRSPSFHSDHDTDVIAILSTLLSGATTANHLDSLVTELGTIDNDDLVFGHLSSTLPAVVKHVSASPHDFAIAGLSEHSFAYLFKLCTIFRKHDLSLLPLLASYRQLLTDSLKTDKCVANEEDLPTTYRVPVLHFNRFFAGRTSQLGLDIDPVQDIAQSELVTRRIFAYRKGPWIWDGAGKDVILDGLKRLQFDDKSESWSRSHRLTSNEWDRSFRSLLSDVVTFQDSADDDRASQFMFRVISLQTLLKLASRTDQIGSTRKELENVLMSFNPWQGVPPSMWLYCTREYLQSAFLIEPTRPSENTLHLPDSLRLQMAVLELSHERNLREE